jgi:hypothetical protein
LYVADPGSQCVWKLKTNHKVDKWLNAQKNVVSLSVTSDGRIVMLIAVDLKGTGVNRTWHGTVEVWDTDGVKHSSMKVPRDIAKPWRIIQTVNKTFTVCHGDRATELRRVCEVNSDGITVKSYGGSHVDVCGQLTTPLSFAFDNEERIFVADNGNRRVLLLSRQMKAERVLLTWTDDRPLSLLYDRETTRLIIGLWSGKVEVFSLL